MDATSNVTSATMDGNVLHAANGTNPTNGAMDATRTTSMVLVNALHAATGTNPTSAANIATSIATSIATINSIARDATANTFSPVPARSIGNNFKPTSGHQGSWAEALGTSKSFGR
jgi:hypothetical protein